MKPASAKIGPQMPLCTPISTGICAESPHWLRPPQIKIPRTLQGRHPETVVGFDLVVSADGSVHDLEVARFSDDLWKDVAVDSARKWKFIPGTYDGRPVPVEIRAIVVFHSIGDPSVVFGPREPFWADPREVQKLFIEACQASSRHDYQNAVTLSRRVLELDPLHKAIRLTLAQALAEQEQYKDAEAAILEEIKLDPMSPFAYNLLGAVYQRNRNYDEAITAYKKQIEVTPDAFEPHANLGVLLTARKRCAEAIPELDKSLALSPGQTRVLLSQGKCDVDLGNTAKGVSEMEEAANQSASSASWNQAAYHLAERNVELEKARKWAEKAINIESALLRDLDLDHATPTQMRLVGAVGNYWDTLGWVYFRMQKYDRALGYIDAAWRMHPTPTKGGHLGQIYEKLGRREDATRTYAMAVASDSLSKRGTSSPEDLAEAGERLAQISGPGANVTALVEQGRAALDALNLVTVENPTKQAGSADFLMNVSGSRILEVRQAAGDPSFAQFSGLLQKLPLPVLVPEENGLQILRRGNLTCRHEEGTCHFGLLTTEEAIDLATKEAEAAKTKIAN
jgi:superkiller protein 3